MTYTVAIGDVHGCLRELESLLSHAVKLYGGHDSRLQFVFVGDYVDRGPDSKGVIDLVRNLVNDGEAVALKGNHEDMMIQGYEDLNYRSAWNFGYGVITLQSWGVGDVRDVPQEDLKWMHDLPIIHRDELRTYVHAGVNRAMAINEQSTEYCIWVRDEFLRNTSDKLGFVVHGHTPLENGNTPLLLKNRLNLDTGMVFNGVLSAAIFNDTEVCPLAFLDHTGRHQVLPSETKKYVVPSWKEL